MEESIQSVKRSLKAVQAVDLAMRLADDVDSEFASEEIDDWEIWDVYDYLSSFGYEWDDYLGWTR